MIRVANSLLLYAIGQGLAFAAGVYLVNALSIQQFAIYSTLLAVSQTLNSACDLGATSSLSYFFRQTALGSGEFNKYVTATLLVRNGLFFLFAAVVVPVFWHSWRMPADLAQDAILIAVTLVMSWLSASTGTLLGVLRISGRVEQAQSIENLGHFVRLAVSVIFIYALSGSALAALMATVVAGGLQLAVLYRRGAPLSERTNSGRPVQEIRHVLAYIAPLVPGSLYYAFQSSLVVWLSAYFGTSHQVAEVGALGRLGQVFGLLGFVSSGLMIPRLAATRDDMFLRTYLLSAAALAGCSFLILIFCMTFPQLVLSILGPQYAGLSKELILVVLGSTTTLLGGYAVLVTRLRGWNRLEPLCVVTQVSGQIALIALIDVSSTFGALLFALASNVVLSAPYVIINYLGFMHTDLVRSNVKSHDDRERASEPAA